MSSSAKTIMWDRLFLLSSDRGTSLQQQIRQRLVSAILEGQLGAESPLPSGRRLADQLGVARNTVVFAYQQLVEEGYLIPRQRSGYFVNPEILKGRVGSPCPHEQNAAASTAWSDRLTFRPSSQRNIVKPIDWQRYTYPFIYGQFDPALFPTNEWRECCMRVLSVMEIRDWAQDMIARDDESLVEQIRTRVLPRRGVFASPDEIVVTMGAQQALHLVAELLISERTTIGIENPGYPDARNIFASRRARLVPLPVDEDGLRADTNLSPLDYLYVTPSHQCPTTVTIPLERREALLALADKQDLVLVEDDYESQNTFSDTPVAALKSLDRSDRVIYVGSLSKTFAPGLRLGYVVAPAELIAELRALRRLTIRHPASFIQRCFALFLSLGHYDALLRRLARAYNERAQVISEAIALHLPDTTHPPIRGGSSCWLRGPDRLDARALARVAQERGVLIEPGDVFFMADRPPHNYFRLGFSSIPAQNIEPGIALLGACIRETAQT